MEPIKETFETHSEAVGAEFFLSNNFSNFSVQVGDKSIQIFEMPDKQFEGIKRHNTWKLIKKLGFFKLLMQLLNKVEYEFEKTDNPEELIEEYEAKLVEILVENGIVEILKKNGIV
ncbi:hypothetical protein [Ekhidna sp.]